MKCPIIEAGYYANTNEAELNTNCLEEECAQYDKQREQCIEITKGQALEKIAKALGRYKG